MKVEIELENLINLFYKIISGKKNQERNWELFRTLFSSEAKLLLLRHHDINILVESYSIDNETVRKSQTLLNAGPL